MQLNIKSVADIRAIVRVSKLAHNVGKPETTNNNDVNEQTYEKLQSGDDNLPLSDAIGLLHSFGVTIQLTLPESTTKFVQSIDSIATAPVAMAVLGDLNKLVK